MRLSGDILNDYINNCTFTSANVQYSIIFITSLEQKSIEDIQCPKNKNVVNKTTQNNQTQATLGHLYFEIFFLKHFENKNEINRILGIEEP